MRVRLILFILLISSSSWAVLPYKTYSVADGLSNSCIKAICQDSLGYMWFGTKNGLIRFDGYQFNTYIYDVQKENTVYNNDITYLTKDNKGLIWIGTFNWIVVFDPFLEKFVDLNLNYPDGETPKGVVTNIWIDKDDKIWIASKSGLYTIEGQNVKVIKALKGEYLNCMAQYDSETLLIEVMNKGLAIYNMKTGKLEYVKESETKNRPMIYKIYQDNKSRVWLGANSNNFFEFDAKNKKLKKMQMAIFNSDVKYGNEQIHDILQFNDSILILGTDNGISTFNLNTHSLSENASESLHADYLLNNRVMALFQDKQKALWVGTFNKGIKYYNPNNYSFKFYNTGANREPLIGVVGNLTEDNGYLYIGNEHGISLMDMQSEKFSNINLLSRLNTSNKKVEPFYLYKDAPHTLYFYLLNRGIYVMNLENHHLKKHISTIPDENQVRCMLNDKVGNIWIAEENITTYNPTSGYVNSNLSTNKSNITSFMLTQELLLRKNGDILVGTRTSGVWIYQFDGKSKYLDALKVDFEQLRGKNIVALFEDKKGNIWVGTYGSGVYKCNLENKTCILFDTSNGLVNNTICGILEDEQNDDIWIAAINGLSKINQKTDKIINYTDKNGFPLEEVSPKAFYKGTNGIFYVGGSNGLASFDPNLFNNNSESFAVRISLIESLNAKKDDSSQTRFDNSIDLKNVELPYNHSSVIVKFSTLNYFLPQGSIFAYKLENFDSEWKLTERNEAVYSNLPAGKYIFKVKASKSDGEWSEHITSIPISIHPPIWLTVWAKILYILIIIALLYFIALYIYNRKTAKYKQQINRIEKENIEKFYQMKLDLFTKFSHELRTPLTLITGPTEDILNESSLPDKLLYPIRLIHKNANRLLLLVNQLMDFKKMEHGAMMLNITQIDIEEFMSQQIESFCELAKKRNISLTFTNHYQGNDLWFDPELMEKVSFNLISNAIKYSDKGDKIEITTKEENGNIILSVRDNGTGIAPENMGKIFKPFYQVEQGNRSGIFGTGIGLNLAEYVIKLHGGNIWAESVLGKGTEFFIKLPLGTSHFDESQIKITDAHNKDTNNQNLERNSVLSIDMEEAKEKQAIDKMTLLIAEDDDDLRHYIISNLSDNYTILEAADGKEALSLALANLPDLIISDVIMPLMNGIELCEKIKKDIKTAHIPVILLTARALNEHIQEGYEALADDYLLKPFNSNLLRLRVHNLIENRIRLRSIFSTEINSIETPTAQLATSDPFMEKLIDAIHKRIDNPELSVNDLCVDLGVSRAQFFRKVKAISDISPNKLILNIRMKMVVDLLKTKQYTIAEIAYKVGFSDPAYLSRIFKTVFNTTPSEYSKSL